MNNLVIGSSGFIGKPLCRYLKSINESVFELDIKNNQFQWTPGHHLSQDARYVSLSLDNAVPIIDRVYFLAWDVGGAKYLYDDDTQLQQLEWNLGLLTNVMPQLKDQKVKFIFVSSQLSDNNDSIYGVTKRLGEIWTNIIGGINVRLWNIYGPYEKNTMRSHVIGDFINQALYNHHINMMTNGKEKRQFIHIDDLTSIMHKLMNEEDSGTFDITTNKWISIYKVAKIISQITGCTIKKGDTKGSETKIDPKHLYKNQTPKIQIYEGLEKTINEYTQNEKI